VTDFETRLADAGEDDLGGMQREIGDAVRTRKILPDTAGELTASVGKRRGALQQPVTA
jgi:hypothetical protein